VKKEKKKMIFKKNKENASEKEAKKIFKKEIEERFKQTEKMFNQYVLGLKITHEDLMNNKADPLLCAEYILRSLNSTFDCPNLEHDKNIIKINPESFFQLKEEYFKDYGNVVDLMELAVGSYKKQVSKLSKEEQQQKIAEFEERVLSSTAATLEKSEKEEADRKEKAVKALWDEVNQRIDNEKKSKIKIDPNGEGK
jgi:hypothetical protein